MHTCVGGKPILFRGFDIHFLVLIVDKVESGAALSRMFIVYLTTFAPPIFEPDCYFHNGYFMIVDSVSKQFAEPCQK